ncbi:DUF1707 SHOCT-like domain-containing protein [Tsukamurella strandjordii]|uniref:DUF1707 domain-containing protein n=1 Tax=Tsukamurella strandjordii TaxID=147577 RepID=A0AA90N8S4_9ACTN|nr:DUF1707 domain-containing protein [Tsukamurella strandjordii]MDP0397847.1 DUF1707 domain-containing protein [Tsukamurella strandjordii]
MSENFDSNEREFDGAGKRARDADREEVMGLLDSALSDGQLDGAEHRDRVATALRASTLGELTGLVDDLQVAAPSFLRPPPPPPPAPVLAKPSPPGPPRPAVRPSAPPAHPTQPAEDSSSTDAVIRTVLTAIGFIAVAVVVIGLIANANNDSGTPRGSVQWSRSCDSQGMNCRDQNGNPTPDMPRDRTAIDGPAIVGNPMASTNVRKVYESVVSALGARSIESVKVSPSESLAAVVLGDDSTKVQIWRLSSGKWHSTTGEDTAVTQTFAPDTMNLDRITATIADAPGITRAAREPDSVNFTVGSVRIDYTGPAGTSSTLILAPDGTVVP